MNTQQAIDAWLDGIVRYVAELPDRNSPEGQPEMLLVTGDELREIIMRTQPEGMQLVPSQEPAEEAEAIIACLGDDAALIRDSHEEIATNMDQAASLIGILLAMPTVGSDEVAVPIEWTDEQQASALEMLTAVRKALGPALSDETMIGAIYDGMTAPYRKIATPVATNG